MKAFGYLEAKVANEKPEADDELFIDRDPTYFEILLQAVRTFCRPPQKSIDVHKQHLLEECAFYCVNNWLPESILGKISSYCMRPQDKRIRDTEISGGIEIVDPFKVAVERGIAADLGTVLLQTNRNCPGFNCASSEVLKSRLDVISGGLLNKLQGLQGVLVAGGAVAAALQSNNRCSDFDLFLMCSPMETLSKVRSIYDACRQTCGKTNLMVTRTNSSVTIFRAAEPALLPIQVRCFSFVGVAIVKLKWGGACDGNYEDSIFDW